MMNGGHEQTNQLHAIMYEFDWDALNHTSHAPQFRMSLLFLKMSGMHACMPRYQKNIIELMSNYIIYYTDYMFNQKNKRL